MTTVIKSSSKKKKKVWRLKDLSKNQRSDFIKLFLSGEMAFPQYTGRVADWIMNEEAPDAFTEAITFMALMTIAR